MLNKLAFPRVTFSWLGLKSRDFRLSLLRKGIFTSSFQTRKVTNFDFFDDDEASNFEVTDGLLYPCCIESECTPKELLREESLRSRLLNKWSSALVTEEQRVAKFFDQNVPSSVLVVQGYEPTNWLARVEAIKRGLPLVALENTALSDRLVFDTVSGITVNQNQASSYYWRFRNMFSEGEVEEGAEKIIASSVSKKSEEHVSPTGCMEIPIQKPILLFLGQVYTDSSILFGSGDWESPVKLLEEVVRIARNLGLRVVAKLHPKEASGTSPIIGKPYNLLTYRKILESSYLVSEIDEGEVLMIDADNSWNTYVLMQKADLAVTMNSQAGLEATMRGLRTVVCGSAFYGGFDFTYNGADTPALKRAIEMALDEKNNEEMNFKSKEFGLIFFEKYCIEKSIRSVTNLIDSTKSLNFPKLSY